MSFKEFLKESLTEGIPIHDKSFPDAPPEVLKWFSSLSINEMKILCKKYFPDHDWTLVSQNSRNIQKMYELEGIQQNKIK